MIKEEPLFYHNFRSIFSKNTKYFAFIFCLSLFACGGKNSRDAIGIFRPPTIAVHTPSYVESTQTPTAVIADYIPVPTPNCVNDLRFIDDLTIPDGTIVSPRDVLDKRWQVLNSGSCNWDEGYSVRLIAGPIMDVPNVQALYPARGGTHSVIRMVFTAPVEPGTYRSAWQAYGKDGEPFGDPFFIEVVVIEVSPDS